MFGAGRGAGTPGTRPGPVGRQSRPDIRRSVRSLIDFGSTDQASLRGAAGKSNGVLDAMVAEGNQIKWLHSYVTSDAKFCIDEAASESLIEAHSQRSGFPANRVISPATSQA